jgi:hypothetical protein
LRGAGNAGLEAETSPPANPYSLELYSRLNAFAIDINRDFAREKLCQNPRNPESHAVKIRWLRILWCKSVGHCDIGIIERDEQTERRSNPELES